MLFDRFKERIRTMRLIDESPKVIAKSFGIGVFIGFTPLIGLHTILALIVAQIFHLNRVSAITGVFVTNPISFIPIYTFCMWFGAVIMGVDVTGLLSQIDWMNITLNNMAVELELLLLPFILGTLIVGVLAGGLGYLLVKGYIEYDRRSDGLPVDDDLEGKED